MSSRLQLGVVALSLGWAMLDLSACDAARSSRSGQISPQRPSIDGAGAFRYGSCPCLYVSNAFGGSSSAGSVTVYTASASGNVPPIGTIAGGNTGMKVPDGIDVDANGNVYVANGEGGNAYTGSITVYPPGANGNVAPAREIVGHNTRLCGPGGIALSGGGQLYVANGCGRITVYAAEANGNVAPIRMITGPNTRLRVPFGVALDASDNVYVVNDRGAGNGTSSITVYAAGSNGNVSPIHEIKGRSTGLRYAQGIARVRLQSGGRIYITNLETSSTAGGSVTEYDASANGNAPPVDTIAGYATGLDSPMGNVAFDAGLNLYVADGANSVMVYAPGASGNAAPMRTLYGSDTGLNLPDALAIH